MLIRNCVQNDDGSLDFDFHVDTEEAAFLMDYAIKSLVFEGILKVQTDQAEQELEIIKDNGGLVQ